MTAARERYFYLVVSFLSLLTASLPYLYGWWNTPPGHVYTGLTVNIDDQCVYLSWMRQAADGHFFQRNLFTTEPQRGVLFNLFFLLLGTILRVTHLPLIAVFHGARVVCGALLLWAAVVLIRETLSEEQARRIAFVLLCVSAGFGWLWSAYDLGAGEQRPIDLWQPEAITFSTLYYTPLFSAALALMLVFVLAVVRAERSGKWRAAWPAMLSGFLLGNMHPYDVVPLFTVWAALRIASDLKIRRIDFGRWAGFGLALLATLPTAGYIGWATRVEPVFYQRALVSSTPTPALYWVLLGYGLLIVLAIYGAVRLRQSRHTAAESTAFSLLTLWSVVQILAAYLPVTFQRKFLMGEHVPLCLLAAIGLSSVVRRLPGDFPKIALPLAFLLLLPTNGVNLLQDIGRLESNTGSTPHRPYLTRGEWEALAWLGQNARPSEAVLVGPDPVSHQRFPFFALYPHLSVYVPALAGCVVYNGHWSETANFGEKITRATQFFSVNTEDNQRRELLRKNGIRYILYPNHLSRVMLETGQSVFQAVSWPQNPPPYLQAVFENADITVYAVRSL